MPDTIGGTVAGWVNIVSGNGNDGIDISDAGTTGNLLAGNYIGTDITGGTVLANLNNGVLISGANNNRVGGTALLARNLISGHHGERLGLRIVKAQGQNLVQGNFIGTQGNGTSVLGNGQQGVILTGVPSRNTIGGSVAGGPTSSPSTAPASLCNRGSAI